jgi:hypothetical protein
MAVPGMGGVFYQVSDPDVLIVDLEATPSQASQSDLRTEVGDFEDLMSMDYEYCCAVEGVAQEGNLWVARNQNKTGLADADLQRFKSVAWNECVVKKFLQSREGDADLVGSSMVAIVQALNLQWSSLQVMGLHPKIEAAEKQVVMNCMEKNFLAHELDVAKVARAFRRCDNFCHYFANAVGAQVVANTGRTPGLSKTQYGTDLDYAYRDKALYYFEGALQRYRPIASRCIQEADSVDYVARLAQLKVVRPPGRVNLQRVESDRRDIVVPVVAGGGGTVVSRSADGGGTDVRGLEMEIKGLRSDFRNLSAMLTDIKKDQNDIIRRTEQATNALVRAAAAMAQGGDPMSTDDINNDTGIDAEQDPRVPTGGRRTAFIVPKSEDRKPAMSGGLP